MDILASAVCACIAARCAYAIDARLPTLPLRRLWRDPVPIYAGRNRDDAPMTAPFMPRSRRALPKPTHPLRVVSITVNATVTRPLRLAGNAGDAWLPALREAMLKRGCLRDRAHQGQCLNCALLPRCGVWPLIAPTDPTRRQSGIYLRPWVPVPPTLPVPPSGTIPVGTQVTHGMTMIQDSTFPALWGRFAAAYVQAARQLAEWGFGAPAPIAGGGVRRGALSVGRVAWLHPVTGETQPFAPDGEADPAPPFWHEEGEDRMAQRQMSAGNWYPTPCIRRWSWPFSPQRGS